MKVLSAVAFLLMTVLSGCVQVPDKRPVAAVNSMNSADVRGSATQRFTERIDSLPSRLRCDRLATADVRMQQSVVAELVGRGELYAALAHVEALPREDADVALLRADILSQLDSGQAMRWYQLLLGSCLAGRAEHGLARIEAAQGMLDKALVRLQRAATAYPVDPGIRHDLGVIWLQLGRLEPARFELLTAQELARDDPRPRISLMLLALLESSPQAWRDAVARWQPDADTRNLLHKRCKSVVAQWPQRSGGQCALALREG